MSDEGVVIERGLPEGLRVAAVEILEEAFGDQNPMAIRDRDKRMAFIGRVLDARHVIVAREDQQLLGLAGLSSKDSAFRGGLLDVSWDPRPHVDLLGWLGATWTVWGLSAAGHRPKDDELYVDGIAVSPAARGRGIGTRIMDEIASIAAEYGKRWVRLDVIDTNPRAQALYERLGYMVTKTESFRYKQRWIGFGAIISMERAVNSDAGAGRPD